MRKKVLWTVVVISVLFSLLFSGCATTIPLDKRDLTTLAPLRVASCVIPYQGVNVWHSGGQTVGTVVGIISPIGGIITSGSVRKWERNLKMEIISAGVPRYYELVMKKFVERSSEEIPGWPHMVVEEQPVDGHYTKKFLKSKSGSLLLLVPARYLPPTFSTAHGFVSDYRAVLYDSDGHLLWQNGFEYSSKKYDRHRSLGEYKADNFKLLKEEMEFAAEATVTDFIESILKETGKPKRTAETEGEQKDITAEKAPQEQSQQKEVSKDFGIISITSDPAGAKIFIDGEYKGQTPAEISLTTGTYQLFIEHQFYKPYTESLMIDKDQTKTLNIRLSPEGEEQR
jgi:hypothetical protein